MTTPSEGSAEEDPRLEQIYERMEASGVSREVMIHENVVVALECNYCNGSVDKTVELLLFFNDAVNGKLLPITHTGEKGVRYNQLVGANNRNGVTCYLDTLLFSMFARLESFEPMLTKQFDLNSDPAKVSLSIFLRLYVNMMRSGKLITTDITRQLLSAIKKAGWNESCFDRQQDVGDLFNFISDALDMPMITLKLEIAHEGKTDKDDDHKLIKERMLLVSVPGGDEGQPILLEQCLENYFANSVNVTRQIERRKTLGTIDAPVGRARKFSVSIQSKEVNGSSTSLNVVESTSQVVVEEGPDETTSDIPPAYDSIFTPQYSSGYPQEKEKTPSSLWTRKMEINLPAWMFLQLVPFYTNSTSQSKTGLPTPIATVEFANTRPVVGICLKRSEWSVDNQSTLNKREILVPQVIRFPSFVAEDEEEVSTNYVLVLESAIFHRGKSTESGHFVAMAKENADIGYEESLKTPSGSMDNNARWLLFDDLLPEGEKVKPVDFDQVFHDEKPYILFYRLVTLDDFERESDRHKVEPPRPSTPIPSLKPPPANASVLSFGDLPLPEHNGFTSASTPTLIRSGTRFLSSSTRRSPKSRPTSFYESASRSPSPLRHSMDDSRNTVAIARQTQDKLTSLRSDEGSKLRRGKSLKRKQKGVSRSGGSAYRDEKCVIQ